MKQTNKPFFLLAATVSISCILFSCKKESPAVASQSKESVQMLRSGLSDTITLRLQPGPGEGSDAMVCYQQNDPVVANTNYGTSKEMHIMWWTTGNSPFDTRAYIKFNKPAEIKKNSVIVSAKLLLYGLPSSDFHPQGNSNYPGSPYTQPNNLLIQQIITDWNQGTITWNNQSSVLVSDLNQIVTRTSTSQWNDNYEIDVTKMVNEMKRTRKNFGFRISLKREAAYRSVSFATSNYPDAARWPAMEIKYVNQ